MVWFWIRKRSIDVVKSEKRRKTEIRPKHEQYKFPKIKTWKMVEFEAIPRRYSKNRKHPNKHDPLIFPPTLYYIPNIK